MTLSTKHTRWPALLLGMTMPGLGQMHSGELLKGICFFAIYQMLALTGLRMAVLLPDRLLAAGVGVVLALAVAFYLWTIHEAARWRSGVSEPKAYNRWYFYLAAWLVGMVGVNGLIIDHIRSSTVEAFKIVTDSMAPTILRGDRVLTDKTAYRRVAPRVGDGVMFINPDDRSKIFIRKIAALPGQQIPGITGSGDVVPRGMVYVLGERSTAVSGSATLGLIPLRDLVGKARQIYWSSGPDGIRWQRIGMTLSGTVFNAAGGGK